MPTTQKDLGEALHLSISTVNAALRNRSDISLATRQRVWEKAREMNYQPNLIARSLVMQETHVIGVVVPDLSRSFFTEVTKGIDQIASSKGYQLLLCNTGEDQERENHQVETLISKRVDGLILASAHPPGSDFVRKYGADRGTPCVLVDRYFPHCHFVGGDDVRIGFLATEHLIERGYRNIAHLRGPNVSTALGRLKGYQKALRKYGIPLRKEYIVEAHYHEESSGFNAVQQLLRISPIPDAVFGASDPVAIGALEAFLKTGLRVPEDVGVVGVGCHRYSEYLRVPLTTVDQNRLEIGRRAALLLLDLINAPDTMKPQVIVIEPRLVVRESSLRSAVSDNLSTSRKRSQGKRERRESPFEPQTLPA